METSQAEIGLKDFLGEVLAPHMFFYIWLLALVWTQTALEVLHEKNSQAGNF